jgi:type III pantothenate kinase
VGIDRLAAAAGAGALRRPDQPVIVLDAGSAITVDAVAADGTFLGGLILPGLHLSAAALAQGTDLLPWIEVPSGQETPAIIGRSTELAIQGGVFWSAVGAIREITTRMRAELGAETLLVMTGGAMAPLARLIDRDACFLPHLVLAGVAVVAGNIG